MSRTSLYLVYLLKQNCLDIIRWTWTDFRRTLSYDPQLFAALLRRIFEKANLICMNKERGGGV